MTGRKNAPAPNKAPRRSRASTDFTLTDRFDEALRKAAADQVVRVHAERDRQAKLDDLVMSAIRAANDAAGEIRITVAELAEAVNLILAQLVEEGVVGGVLPPADRIRSLVKRAVTEKQPPDADQPLP